MRTLVSLTGALGWVLISPLVAAAARISLTGQVALLSEAPIANARITVIFHGHERGIHEYTTERRTRVETDEDGYFSAFVKVPDDRYIWTHATIEIGETESSKAATAIARCQVDEQGGGHCSRKLRVNPLVQD